MKEILFMKPVLKNMIWGGNRLREFGYDIPTETTGECWAISAHKNGDCVVKSGAFAGMTLSELWDNHRELFGNVDSDRYPLLIKIIDAKNDLSIQVHPDDSYAKEHENGSFGKTECWYILDCDPDATIIVGHNAKTSEEVKDMILNERWNEFYREIPIKKGDFFQINPGTLHAIKGGTLILETQQNSDITYRVYDYGRLQNGKPRELHVQQSIDVITAPYVPDALDSQVTETIGDATITKLISCDKYEVYHGFVDGTVKLTQDKSFQNVSILDGEGDICGTPLKKGDHFILPCGFEDYCLNGKMEFMISNLPQ